MTTKSQSVRGLTCKGLIFVRDYQQTHIARFCGKTASCTASREEAARAVARKVMVDREYVVEKCGNDYVWQVLA